MVMYNLESFTYWWCPSDQLVQGNFNSDNLCWGLVSFKVLSSEGDSDLMGEWRGYGLRKEIDPKQLELCGSQSSPYFSLHPTLPFFVVNLL